MRNWTKSKNKAKITNNLTIIATFLFLLFVFLFICIASWKTIKLISKNGFGYFVFNDNFTNLNVSILNSIAYTFVLAFLTLVVSIPFALKVAIFINFRTQNKLQKSLKFIFKIMGALPSVVFALFALKFLSNGTKLIFNIVQGQNFFSALQMFYIFNCAVLINLLNNVLNEFQLLHKRLAKDKGLSDSIIIYKIILIEKKKQIFKTFFMAFMKVVGEASAASFILLSNSLENVWNKGVFGFLTSSSKPAATLITTNFLNSSNQVRDYLFALSLTLIVFISIINFIIYRFSSLNFKQISQKQLILKYSSKLSNTKNKKYWSIYNHYKIISEFFAFILISLIFALMFLFIMFKGLKAIFSVQNTLKFENNSVIWTSGITLYAALWCTLLSVPISFLISLYFQNSNPKSWFKKILNIFLLISDGFPSLIHGLFAYTIFIQFFHLSLDHQHNTSLLAGVFAVVVLLIPTIVREFNNSFKQIDKNVISILKTKHTTKTFHTFKIKSILLIPTFIKVVLINFALFIAEASPFLLTSDHHNSSVFSLLYPQQTLTTRIVAQLNLDSSNSVNVMYESAFVIIILIVSLITLQTNLIPKLNLKSQKKLNSYFRKMNIDFEFDDKKSKVIWL
ncbi:ABC transporter permease subunit [Mycoplasmopsis phocirhinis]|uniref:ABC transporter permease subunit n=1 Tax=Mycoplasmopsis phocirhinis TaxID=142650 RepID=A0A4P6MRC5_9BACT|nr:ABC transporter permease subunit [Mycoplasmopsis phocirhinis]QBF34371.1 ABC transporter permease subunit [Mycoplasmopsis phocirhinis]